MSRIHFPPEDSEEPQKAPDDGETEAEPPRDPGGPIMRSRCIQVLLCCTSAVMEHRRENRASDLLLGRDGRRDWKGNGISNNVGKILQVSLVSLKLVSPPLLLLLWAAAAAAEVPSIFSV